MFNDSPRRRRVLITLGCLLALAAAGRALQWDEQLYRAGQAATIDRVAALRLADYEVEIDAQAVTGISENLSSLSYDPELDQLWATTNSRPTALLALSRSGELLAHYPLPDFGDVESVEYLGNNLLALVDEYHQRIFIIERPGERGTPTMARARTLSLGIGSGGNNGFEGLAYDVTNDRLFVARERRPRRLYEIRGLRTSLEGNLNLDILDRSHWLRQVMTRDLSGLHFDAGSGHLLLLSDESRALIALDREGHYAGHLELRASAGLRKAIPQVEGVAMDGHGTLFLASEPNLFYRLRP